MQIVLELTEMELEDYFWLHLWLIMIAYPMPELFLTLKVNFELARVAIGSPNSQKSQ